MTDGITFVRLPEVPLGALVAHMSDPRVAEHMPLLTGPWIAKMALAFAADEARIPYVTFLLPPSRRNLGALARLGAQYIGDIDYSGTPFRKYRLETAG